MRNLSYTLTFVAIMLAIVSSCKKDNIKTIANNVPLIGKWKLNANFFGTGSAPTWQPVAANDNHIVVFNADGSLGGNVYSQYYSYKLKDSLLTFSNAADGELRLLYTIKHDTLIMTPAGPLCIEGCAIRFIKQ
ncbi:MAG: hypothetical protein JWQ34_3326 [Mucilaginibacter sp.]|uniref:hypothetical protein n=1 Tax=Mucilaginibacter sp. TaxID=1882438 RepID=UPI00261B893A|nr:hypothetical protein [Mucilaginibacter sp.]MDB5005101.1 hypothetical protein [Mucilaginibacter sp.]